MATKIYETKIIYALDGTEIELMPLKIKYLRKFMDAFEKINTITNDNDAIEIFSECAYIAMKQFLPNIKTIDDFEDNFDLESVYTILDITAGVKVKPDQNSDAIDTETKQAKESGNTWQNLDLVKLESEVFLLGIWKDYEELESSISMPELTALLDAKRDIDYEEKKFAAAIQGIDLDEQSGQTNAWEEMKARVFSGGTTNDPNDILALQGQNAKNAGFGIGMGLSYETWD
jgi:hypothetical protein